MFPLVRSSTHVLTSDHRFCSGGTFKVSEDAEYRWKTHKGRFQVRIPSIPGRACVIAHCLARMQLIKSDDPEKKPLAEFHPHQRHFFVFRMSKHAYFQLQPIPEIMQAIDKFIGASLSALPLSVRPHI